MASALWLKRNSMARETYRHWLRTSQTVSTFGTITCRVDLSTLPARVIVESPGCDSQSFTARKSWSL